MKKNKYITGSVVYVMRPQYAENDLVKIGKTGNLKKRMQIINNSLPDHADVLYYIETDQIDKLKKIIKNVLIDHVYMRNKEYYKISIPKIIIIFDKCFEFMNKISKPLTERQKVDNLNDMTTLKKNIKKEFERQGLLDDESYDEDNDINQEGGDYEYDNDENNIDYDINDPTIYLYQEDLEENDDDIIQEGGYELAYSIYKIKYIELKNRLP
jgi:hypothetical protein